MGRLTERDIQGNPMLCMEGCSWTELLTKLAHYEDMAEQGRLIELPCKVGTPIYYIAWEYDELNDKAYFIGEDTFCIDDLAGWGEYGFLTKEEAEAKLKELEG